METYDPKIFLLHSLRLQDKSRTQAELLIGDNDAFLKVDVIGDGACMYRAMAHCLFYRLTNINLFMDTNRQVGIKDNNGIGENYDSQSINNIILNILTRWLKFYIYLILCTNISVQNISWKNGVTNMASVVVMKSINNVLDPQTLLDNLNCVNNVNYSGKCHIPSLSFLFIYCEILWKTYNFDIKNLKAEVNRHSYDFSAILPYIAPLVIVPMDKGPFVRSEIYPSDKTVYLYDQGARNYQMKILDDLMLAAENFSRKTPTDAEKAYQNFIDDFINYRRYGGYVESKSFDAILLSMNTEVKLKSRFFSTYIYTSETKLEPYLETIVGWGFDTTQDTTEQITIFWKNNHYQSILLLDENLNLQLPLMIEDENQQKKYKYAPDSVPPVFKLKYLYDFNLAWMELFVGEPPSRTTRAKRSRSYYPDEFEEETSTRPTKQLVSLQKQEAHAKKIFFELITAGQIDLSTSENRNVSEETFLRECLNVGIPLNVITSVWVDNI